MPIDYVGLAARFGTPLYVYDLETVRNRARALRTVFRYQPLHLLYAIKACPCPAVARVLLAEDYGLDAVSPGEVALARRVGWPVERILFTENNMTDAEMAAARNEGVLINCGSLDRLERLGKAGARAAAVRFNPDAGAGEHDHTITAGPKTKFGVHHGQVDQVLAIEAATGIRVVGCHMHIGSNILDAEAFVRAMAVLLDLARRLPHLRFLDFGGGLGVPYKPDQQPLDLPRLGREADRLMEEFVRRDGRKLALHLEPGRFLVAESAVLLTTVTSLKTRPGPDGRTFAGCDTGFNHLVRPTMYGSYHPIANLSNPSGQPTVVDVVGNLCESGDVFARDRSLPQPRLGDLLALGVAGAYGMAMASTYNMRPLPPEVAVDGDRVTLVRRRQTVDDLLAQWQW